MLNEDENLLAILGPTNTGKTYTAFEKLFSFSSGIFGFPLRLLARENYDKAVKRIGFSNVALITGEEKILPKEAKYFFCTVESMPINIPVDCVMFLQLSSDDERLSSEEKNNSLVTSCCLLTDTEVETFIDSQNL